MINFIGKRVNLEVTFRTTRYGEVPIYKIDDEVMVEKIVDAYGPSTRIIPPGTMVTQDMMPFRTNVHLDENGIITEITNG